MFFCGLFMMSSDLDLFVFAAETVDYCRLPLLLPTECEFFIHYSEERGSAIQLQFCAGVDWDRESSSERLIRGYGLQKITLITQGCLHYC